MQPVEFPQQTAVLAKDQPQYTPLPVHVGSKEEGFPMTACFELSDEEIAEIVATRKLWHTQVTFGHAFQPVMQSTKNPFIEAPNIHVQLPQVVGWPDEIAQSVRAAFRYTGASTEERTGAADSLLLYLSVKLIPKGSPIAALVPALLNDPEYRETWKANIAMAFYDAYFHPEAAPSDAVRESVANNFLNTLCNQLQQAICKAQ